MRRTLATIIALSLGWAVGNAQPQQFPRTIIAHPIEYRNQLGPWNSCTGQVTITLSGTEIRLEHFGKSSWLTHLVRLPSRQGEGTNEDGFKAQREGDGAAMTVLVQYDSQRDADALWIVFKDAASDGTVTYRVINRPQVQR
jgi:hypothetical protein